MLGTRNGADQARSDVRARAPSQKGDLLSLPPESCARSWEMFEAWLPAEGLNVREVVPPPGTSADVDMINIILTRYGRALYQAGRPYSHYAETVSEEAAPARLGHGLPMVAARTPRSPRCDALSNFCGDGNSMLMLGMDSPSGHTGSGMGWPRQDWRGPPCRKRRLGVASRRRKCGPRAPFGEKTENEIFGSKASSLSFGPTPALQSCFVGIRRPRRGISPLAHVRPDL